MDMIEPTARATIEARLEAVAREEGVRFLMAVESGSRAWGFPSPDSDYDVRFIYVRPWQDYVTLRPIRDVIERPILDDFDVNGWDISKTLGLMLRHNAVVAEWLESLSAICPTTRLWRNWPRSPIAISIRTDMRFTMPASA